MVKDSVENAAMYAGMSPRIRAAFDFIANGGLEDIADGRTEIDGDNLYVNVQTNTLKSWSEGKWELHRKYADIQYVIEGSQVIGYCEKDALVPGEGYSEPNDIEFRPDAAGIGTGLAMQEGDFAIFFPQDAHRPNTLMSGQVPGTKVRMAVFKVKL